MPWRVVIILCLIWLTIYMVASLFPRPAKSHDWYEKFCCSDGDCQLAPPGSVEATGDGFLVREGTTNPKGIRLMKNVLIPYGHYRIRPLPPDVPPGMHICTSSGTVYCIYLDAGI